MHDRLPWAADPDFLSGGGEMGALMRAHDWSASPLGDPSTWPQSLRSVVGLLLGSKFPMFVAWGEGLGFLYNDAYAEILGAKHPRALGARFHDIWAEIWPDISPLIDAALAGEATYRENLPLLMNRKGFDEQTWFTFSYSPVRDESSRIAGMFCAVAETTDQVLAERRQTFRIKLEEVLRDLADPRAIMTAAVEALGQHLGANRVGYSEVQADGETIVCETCFADGVEPLVGTFSLKDFGPDSIVRQRGGRIDVCDDLAADPAQVHATWAAIETRAFVSVPLIRDGRFTASLYVNFREPHRWTSDEVMLIEDVAARTWAAVERARAEEAREGLARQLVEERTRLETLIETLPVGVALVGSDGATLLSNPAFRRYRPDGVMPSRLSDDREQWIAYDDQGRQLPKSQYPSARALQGELVTGIEFLHRSPEGQESWTRVSGVPLQDAEGRVSGALAVVVDIDEIKRSEEHQRLLINELNHRVKNTLATVQSIATQTLRNASTTDDARDALEGRLLALSRAHDVLTRENWEGAELREIAAQAIEPYSSRGEDRLHVTGPQVRLPPRMALALAMVLQELATNAVKYGALSNATGTIRISWRVDGEAPERLHFRWEESGGPPVAPPTRRGFGTRLIERSLAQDLDGDVRIDFAPTGVTCTVDAPIA